MKAHNQWLGGCLLALTLSGCATITNVSLCPKGSSESCLYNVDPRSSYRFAPKVDKQTLVIVTLSGGGARAAALAFGTLETLKDLGPTKINTDGATSLLDQVDIISSVSGGSVTAAWYALNGQAGLARSGEDGKLWQFLNDHWMGEIYWRGLNPWTLARYVFTPYTRSDVLSDFFRDHLFGEVTYEEVLRKYREKAHRPYVILNATDLGNEATFPFTQGHFDLLCSDLRRYRVANAVAASSNFPLAFSPMGLENYSGCAAQDTEAWKNDGPLQWTIHYKQFDGPYAAIPESNQLNELRSARLATDYLAPASGPNGQRYVHLVDGGVADNLGMRSTLALEDDPARVPSLYLRLSGPRPEGYQSVRTILYVVVNARTRDPKGIDAARSPPGEITTALRMVDTQLDSSTLADQDYLIAELEATAREPVGGGSTGLAGGSVGGTCQNALPFLSCKRDAQATHEALPGGVQYDVVSVDFEMIPTKDCRDKAWELPTNWGLESDQVKGLVELARVILMSSPELRDFYTRTQTAIPSALMPTGRNRAEAFAEACHLIGAGTQVAAAQ
jgi:NTE family protein